MNVTPSRHGSDAAPPGLAPGGTASRPATPCALDFALLLHARQAVEDRAGPYLAEVQTHLRLALEERGYREVCLRPLAGAAAPQDVAAFAAVVLLARLPLEGLKTPVVRVQLPLVVTYAGQLTVQGVQVNRLTVDEAFVRPLSVLPAEVADDLVQFFSERYMTHLLAGGPTPGA